MKYTSKFIGVLAALLLSTTIFAQKRVDGVVAVVGDYVVLDSDIDKTYLEIKSRGVNIEGIKRCELLGMLLEDKFYAHHAVQDSVPVNDEEVRAIMENNIEYLVKNLGSMSKVLEYYRKKSEDDFRAELEEITRTNKLTEGMKRKITEEVEITPEEVRTFFKSIPKDSLPIFGVELEVSQIIIEPVIPEAEKQKVIDKLNEFRTDILNNNGSFFSKAVLYSEDPGSKSNGGYYKLTRKSPMVKEFKDVAFSLNEGEISEPFETEFGYHIIYLEKIKGQELEVRHILLTPKITDQAMREAREKAVRIREKIVAGEISFADAARSESDEKETKANGGILINPSTQDTRFELTRMDPRLYSQISGLKDNEVSQPLIDETQTGRKRYKLITVTNRYEEHVADYAKDYTKIKEMALQAKQMETIKKWFDEKLPDTYIKIDEAYQGCDFQNNWLQK
ncbi:MAG: peptidylprolyl isomerase [Flavobacteriaceae bacterium]